MLRFVLTRMAGAIGVVWLVATLVFFALRIFSDPLEAVMGGPGSQASPEATAAAIEFYGFDQPLIQQYLIQLRHLITWDFGQSYARNQPVWELVAPATGSTLILAASSFLVALLIAGATVYLAALTTGGRVSRAALSALRAFHAVAAVIPHFWLGATFIAVLSVGLAWLPATAGQSDVRSLIIPSLTLGIPTGAYLAQIMDDALGGSHRSGFAFATRARGATEKQVFTWHSARHLLIATAPSLGWALGSMLSGAVVIETLMARQGLGRLMFEAALGSDIPLVIGIVTVVAAIYVVVMLVVDVLTAILDPRTLTARTGRRRITAASVGEL